jgi:hypothetical protein
MHFTFDHFASEMKKDPRVKVTREAWSNKARFIQWNYQDQVFIEHLPGGRAHEWCWENYDDAKEDILTEDWIKLPCMEVID